MQKGIILIFIIFLVPTSFGQQQNISKLDIYLEQLRVQYNAVDLFNAQSDSTYKLQTVQSKKQQLQNSVGCVFYYKGLNKY